jgi:hypothetical protein
MRRLTVRRAAGFILVAVLLLICGACRTPGEYRPRQDRSARTVTYQQVVPPTTDVYAQPMP